jgi:hypothetical protein
MIALGIVTPDHMRSNQRNPEKFQNAEHGFDGDEG